MGSFPRPPRIIGHRGAAGSAPENTLASIREAARQGARWVEFDAKLTADDAIVLLHDDELGRTTSGTGPAAKQSLAQIRELDAGSWFAEKFRDARVPTLKEATAALVDLDLGCNVEIKPCPGREVETGEIVMRELAGLWAKHGDLPLVSSFSRDCLVAARRLAPNWPMGVLFNDQPADWLDWAARIGSMSVHCSHKTLTSSWAMAIKSSGFLLLVYTVNEVDLAHRLFDWGVDSIFTDMPGRLLEAGLG